MAKEEEFVREDVSYISGEYLSAASHMVAMQIIDSPLEELKAWKKDQMPELKERMSYLMRQHAPIAYSYFFQNSSSEDVLPQGTVDIILEMIWKRLPAFMGGKNSGIIIAKDFRG